MTPPWTFALPPSVGWSLETATQIRTALTSVGCTLVKTALSYQSLVEELMDGSVNLAWAPPLVCAQVEAQGASVLLQALRGGAAAYRSVVFARADRKLNLATLHSVKAGWMDEKSMSGYLLPRAYLKKLGVVTQQAFSHERFLGSTAACVQAVLDGKVDLSATYASPTAAQHRKDGFSEHAGQRSRELVALGYSQECPNDGLVLSPVHAGAAVAAWRALISGLLADDTAHALLLKALDVEGFQPPAPDEYASLVAYLG